MVLAFREENAGEENNLPRYRDRAKERREDVNPDYDSTSAELGSLHALGPPGTVDLRYVKRFYFYSVTNCSCIGAS